MLISALASPVLAVEFGEDDWPQWRGPTRNGHAAGDAWPDSLSEKHLNQAWNVDLGPSYSGPIVMGSRVFTTETRDSTTEVVSAYNRHTGKLLWSTDWPGAMTVPFFAAENGSWIRATPASDGKTLYVAGMLDVLVALDTTNGKEHWRIDFKEKFGTPNPTFGFVSSPLIHDDAIYVQAGGGFIKIDKQTGNIVWRSANDGGGMMGSAFSSPIIATLHGRTMALVQTRLEIKGIDIETGDELWSEPIEAFQGMNILSPTVYKDQIFTSAHTGRSQLWKLLISDENTQALEEVWMNSYQAYMSSPVVVGDHLYMHLRNQRIQCLDLNSGKETWRSNPYGKYQSMVVLNDRILALDQDGRLLLIEANPKEFNVIDSRQLSESETWAHVAICGGQVFVRELNRLAVYNWK